NGRILRADLGEDGEVAREVGDQLELALTRNLDRPVGDLHVREAELCDPRLVLVETVARIDDLEERPADDNGLFAEHLELPRQIRGDGCRAPAELDDRDVVPGNLENVLPRARTEPLVEHMGQPVMRLKVEHSIPPTSSWRARARRGRASCRDWRCRASAG